MMKKFLLAAFVLAFMPSAHAQYVSGCDGRGVIPCYATTSGVVYSVSGQGDDYTYRVAEWAVELQLRNWLGKKPQDLTRADIKKARERLEVLCKWAKETVENKVFSQAYLTWAGNMKSTLDTASTKLDHDEIASALLLHGLPALPDGAK